MARALTPDVPPDLKPLWDRLTVTKPTLYGNTLTIIPHPSLKSGSAPDEQTMLARAASAYAAWLRDRHAAGLSKTARSRFFSERREEIRAGIVNPAYWEAAALLSDVVQWRAPDVSAYTDDWNGLYYDPLRLPSKCRYGSPSLTYPFAEAGTAAEKPLPGWAGAVVGNTFQDLWLAQRLLILSLPRTVARSDGWPILATVDATIQAQATVRGNRNWFAVAVGCKFSTLSWFFGKDWDKLRPFWPREMRYLPEINGDMPTGWSQTITRRVIQDGRFEAGWTTDNPCGYCSFRVIIPPSIGVYFSRNDSASAIHTVTPALYIARP